MRAYYLLNLVQLFCLSTAVAIRAMRACIRERAAARAARAHSSDRMLGYGAPPPVCMHRYAYGCMPLNCVQLALETTGSSVLFPGGCVWVLGCPGDSCVLLSDDFCFFLRIFFCFFCFFCFLAFALAARHPAGPHFARFNFDGLSHFC